MNSDDSPFASRRESPGIEASPIDRAIDRAVRKMMQVDPPAGLRRRVMARIEKPQRRSFFVPAFAVAAAGVAVLVLGVIATRNRVDPVPAAAPTTAAVEKAPPAEHRVAQALPEPAPQPRPQRVPAQRRTGFRREPIPMAPVADIFGTPANSVVAASDPTAAAVWTAPAVPGLDELIAAPVPLIVRPVGVPPIETLPIVIAPLVVGKPGGL